MFEKYSGDGNLSSYVQTQEIFKAVTAKYTAPDLIAQCSKVSNDNYAALREKLSLYGAQVINSDMRNSPSPIRHARDQREGDAGAAATGRREQAQDGALKIQNAALAQNKDVLELRRIEVQMTQAKAWNGVLPVNVHGSAPIPFINLTPAPAAR